VTDLTPEQKRAQDAAREPGTQRFGVQHTRPAEQPLPAPVEPEKSHADVLCELSYVHASDAWQADQKTMQTRVEAFVADARQYVPDAVAAQFSWDYDLEAGTRLVFDYYVGEGGVLVDSDDYPDISDFHVEDRKHAATFGFDENEDGYAILEFDNVAVRDEAKARAELAASKKLDGFPQAAQLRGLLVAAMGGENGIDPKWVENLTDKDRDELLLIFAAAIDRTHEYLAQSA